ncbi:Protein of unknown function [Mesobacillus persicus]|uniref:DUF3993 domain-containing protein n=1 Tax=Mesobacillus persicus TaxID=930146 RepID=A0A1H8FL46_9BACI|nr:DUF3993 domain-containing protein [Mesobacillus persicus]SEN32419.1 Protein of unknown function [Mesobacillus persicus]
MDRRINLLILCIVVFIIVLPLQANSERDKDRETTLLNQEEIFAFLEDAFSAQVSLSEVERSLEGVKEVLFPYFSDDYIDMFIKENVVEENGKFFTLGSDFARYYIPFYTYSNQTKVVQLNDSVFVVEFFPASTEGPVTYDDHYVALELKSENTGWKIQAIQNDNLPREVLEKANFADSL